MEDTSTCPVCNNKLRVVKLNNKYLYQIDKTANFLEKVCVEPNHCLRIFVDAKTNQVDLARFSLNHKYTTLLEIDFIRQKCRITCLKMNEPHYIDIPKIIPPDFPKLEKLKEKIDMYITFS